MWCRLCQQDVPAIATGVLPRPKCPRCGNVLARGATEASPFDAADFLQGGMDLAAIRLVHARDSMSHGIDWEIRERLCQAARTLEQPAPLGPLTKPRRDRIDTVSCKEFCPQSSCAPSDPEGPVVGRGAPDATEAVAARHFAVAMGVTLTFLMSTCFLGPMLLALPGDAS